MNPSILNRDFVHPSDGWYMIEPKGEHPNRRGGVVQIIDDEAGQAIANRFNADADAGTLSHGREMLIDHEHFKHDSTKETTAFGWLYRLQNRADGIYGRVRWTGTGKTAVDGGDYRFFSTEYNPDDLTILNKSTPKRVRPMRLDGLTLTNDPNNKGAKPITNRATGDVVVSNRAQEEKQAKAIMNRADGLRRQFPRISLATAVIMAQRDTGSAVFNRALELSQGNRAMNLASACVAAQRGQSSFIFNRASQIHAANSAISLPAAIRQAQNDPVYTITNRVSELRKQLPGLSLATAYAMAAREAGGMQKLLNRDGDQVSDADWKAAQAKADDVLNFLETKDAITSDVGMTDSFQNLPAKNKFYVFMGAINRLVTDEGLSISDAFQKLCNTQPVLWTQSMLAFDAYQQTI